MSQTTNQSIKFPTRYRSPMPAPKANLTLKGHTEVTCPGNFRMKYEKLGFIEKLRKRKTDGRINPGRLE
jgi:hypothetical protein